MAELPNSNNAQNGGIGLKRFDRKTLAIVSWVMSVVMSVFVASVVVVSVAIIDHLEMPLVFAWLIVISGLLCVVIANLLIDTMLSKWEGK